MKKLALLLVFCPLMASAQGKNRSYASTGASEVGVGLGFTKGAFNIAAQYEKRSDGLGHGGYFFFQADKEKNGSKSVNQVMSFGGQMKAHVLNTNRVDAYLAPGFGLHMIKDVPDASASSGKTDVTAFGPTLRIGVLLPISPTMKVGLDRLELWNWFDEKASSAYAFYSATMAFDF
ncbi:MAG: hypothetical protein ACK5P7_01795 [Bdellovibrio sp.]|jgi:hypothetical protein